MVAWLSREPLAEPDYVSIANPITLTEVAGTAEHPVLASLTVKFGKTRLLDNMMLPLDLNDRHGLSATLGAV
jgi:pantoate--beta-alanine ligase